MTRDARLARIVAVSAGPRHSAIVYLTTGMLLASMMLGGGTRQGLIGDVILQAIGLPLLVACALELMARGATPAMKAPLIYIAICGALPMLQLVPLPQGLWEALPGRSGISETYALIGKPRPALPLTLSPSATWNGALALLPPLSIFLGCLLLTGRERKAVVGVLVAFAVVSVFVGLFQLAGGPGSPLRFYSVTNKTEAVGFFANRNHFAALLYAAMILAMYWLGDAATRATSAWHRAIIESKSAIELLAAIIAVAIILAGLFMTRSRAGLLLSAPAALGGLALMVCGSRAKVVTGNAIRISLCAAILAIALSQQVSLSRLLARIPDAIAGSRATIAANTIVAAHDYLPFGSGIGTFVPVYQLYESPAEIGVTYVNHAHNDLLELWLEAGVPGVILALVAVFWLARRSVALWRGGERPGDVDESDLGLMRAASIIPVLFAAHALVDYPLRTSALMGLAGLACALLVPPMATGSSETAAGKESVRGRHVDGRH